MHVSLRIKFSNPSIQRTYNQGRVLRRSQALVGENRVEGEVSRGERFGFWSMVCGNKGLVTHCLCLAGDDGWIYIFMAQQTTASSLEWLACVE